MARYRDPVSARFTRSLKEWTKADKQTIGQTKEKPLDQEQDERPFDPRNSNCREAA